MGRGTEESSRVHVGFCGVDYVVLDFCDSERGEEGLGHEDATEEGGGGRSKGQERLKYGG